ncbi:MAG: Gfo/Idh/MocA family oxidoreductase [Planctomycetota bacterium]
MNTPDVFDRGRGPLPPLTRREFMTKAALAGGAIAAPTLIPASALGKDGAVAPGERIVMAGIGIGGRGSADLNALLHESEVQVVAVCDVQKTKREAAKGMVDAKYGNKDCATYRDLRDMFAERRDLDAVLIATGDRWHALASILAMQAGKDVYCEKPGTLFIAEGPALVETACRYGRVFQTGVQRLSEANFIVAGELLRTGRLGKVHTVYAHLWHAATSTWPRKGDVLPPEPEPDREELDWDLWLGPCPWRPYNKGYVHGGWHRQPDFATGVAQWGSHTICQCQVDLGLADTSPVEYEYPKSGDAEGLTAHFANGVKLVITRNGWRGSCGIRYEGTEGWVAVADGYERPDVSTPSLLADFKKLLNDYLARTGHRLNHIRDFLHAIRTRRRSIAHEEVAHRTMTTNHIMDIVMELRRNLTWDPTKEEFVNDPEADRMRSRALREPWRV